jgi:predicted membrane protein
MKKKICATICIISIILMLMIVGNVELGDSLFRLLWCFLLLGVFGVSAEIGGFNK